MKPRLLRNGRCQTKAPAWAPISERLSGPRLHGKRVERPDADTSTPDPHRPVSVHRVVPARQNQASLPSTVHLKEKGILWKSLVVEGVVMFKDKYQHSISRKENRSCNNLNNTH